MGTTPPLVRIEAATLAGGVKNQDRYAYGDGWAFVLDGASSIDSPKSGHDGGWYAERLKNALSTRLNEGSARPTVDIVADAITEAASAHDLHDGACPTSTIALARWNADQIEIYILGDSYAIIFTDEGPMLMTDDRLATVAPDLRTKYRQRLVHGSGFDATHRALLRELQHREALSRNRDGGYWIAGDAPDAARHAVTQHLPKGQVQAVALLTDGILAADRTLWANVADMAPSRVISGAVRFEKSDPQAIHYPRSKPHDDKSIIVLRIREIRSECAVLGSHGSHTEE